MQFHMLSFEGPDSYAQAGGIASRISGLSVALADSGFETHLWFIGDPDLPGYEVRGNLTLHRWCQWISRHHPRGVYDGEEYKRADFSASLAPYLVHHVLLPYLRTTKEKAVVLAEEWQTVDAVLYLDWLLQEAGVRERVLILWNANNVFGFNRIDWGRLKGAATVTTVSRYMRHRMWSEGVDPLVIPNGLTADAFQAPERAAVNRIRQQTRDRIMLTKMARWDPDKRWLLAVDTVGELKRRGHRPLLVARGGMEAHGQEVLARAAGLGLRVAERGWSEDVAGTRGLVESLDGLSSADIVVLHSHVDPDARRVLLRSSDAVLANSGHEPFGLVGLETMAAGGLACTGGTGEDYAIPGWNALVLQTCDPTEFADLYQRLEFHPEEARRLRQRAKATARQYVWDSVVERNFMPRLGLHDSPAEPSAPLPSSIRVQGAPRVNRPMSFDIGRTPAGTL